MTKIDMLKICKNICTNNYKYCFLCLRTENVRKLSPTKTLEKLFDFLRKDVLFKRKDKDTTHSWNLKIGYKSHLVCCVCEARMATVLRVVTLLQFSIKSHGVLKVVKHYKKMTAKQCEVQEAEAARRFTALHVTQTLVVNSKIPSPDDEDDNDCVLVDDIDDVKDDVRERDDVRDDVTAATNLNGGELEVGASIDIDESDDEEHKELSCTTYSRQPQHITTVPISRLLKNPTNDIPPDDRIPMPELSHPTIENNPLLKQVLTSPNEENDESILPDITERNLKQNVDVPPVQMPSQVLMHNPNFIPVDIDRLNTNLTQNKPINQNLQIQIQIQSATSDVMVPFVRKIPKNITQPVLIPNISGVEGSMMLAIRNPTGEDFLLHHIVNGADGAMYVPTLPGKIIDGKLEMLSDFNALNQSVAQGTPTINFNVKNNTIELSPMTNLQNLMHNSISTLTVNDNSNETKMIKRKLGDIPVGHLYSEPVMKYPGLAPSTATKPVKHSESGPRIPVNNFAIPETVKGRSQTMMGRSETVMGRHETVMGRSETMMGRPETVICWSDRVKVTVNQQETVPVPKPQEKSSNVDWEDKIPMDVITYLENNPTVSQPVITNVYSQKEQDDACRHLQDVLRNSIDAMFDRDDDVTATVISIDD